MVSGSLPDRSEIAPLIDRLMNEARSYLAGLDALPARSPGAAAVAGRFTGPLPETGVGAAEALRELLEEGRDGILSTGGPRSYHFVMGGTTPAAAAAEVWAAVTDQAAYAWVTSPLAVHLETLALTWLKQLFGLPAGHAGIIVTGATMANFVGLASARQWWGERHGVDIGEKGASGLPALPVLSGGYIHPSARKALAMLGVGRNGVTLCSKDAVGRVDLDAMTGHLERLDGAPAVIVANAGEVNTGDFDPIARLADLAGRFGAWLHVDGAFGLFAQVSPRTRHLTEGVERADSVTVDGHKWLNVPYDSGYAFVREARLMAGTFAYSAAYLPGPDDPHPNFGAIGPESSRRARAFAVWATLRAYGREGHRDIVERHLDLAQHLARNVDAAPDLERLAEVPLNIVCFRYNPGGLSEERLNVVNRRLGEMILEDGRFYSGGTVYGSTAALRPALVNWRIGESDLDAYTEVVRELGARAVREA